MSIIYRRARSIPVHQGATILIPILVVYVTFILMC